MTLLAKINETAAFLKGKEIEAPEFGLILGSGLGELAEEIENAVVVDYSDIPNWGQSTVVGHAGKLVYGDLAGRKVLALQGRFHFYEGNPLEVVTFPVRVMKVLGCEGVLVTNAAGGIGFGPGTLMAITDHINMTGQNPLIGENLVLGISCITNFAAGFQEELNHEEVVEVTERVKGDFKGLLKAILAEL